jgi:translocator protein
MDRAIARLAAPAPDDRAARLVAAALAAGAVTLTSWIGATATAPALEAWYPALAKPALTPPDWAFPVAWTALFAMMAAASWLVWRDGGRSAWPALRLYGASLALNALWSVAFFGFQSPGAGLLVLAPFLASIVGCIATFRPHSALAAALMLPYLAWVTFAALLNAAIWWIN